MREPCKTFRYSCIDADLAAEVVACADDLWLNRPSDVTVNKSRAILALNCRIFRRLSIKIWKTQYIFPCSELRTQDTIAVNINPSFIRNWLNHAYQFRLEPTQCTDEKQRHWLNCLQSANTTYAMAMKTSCLYYKLFTNCCTAGLDCNGWPVVSSKNLLLDGCQACYRITHGCWLGSSNKLSEHLPVTLSWRLWIQSASFFVEKLVYW